MSLELARNAAHRKNVSLGLSLSALRIPTKPGADHDPIAAKRAVNVAAVIGTKMRTL